MAKYRSTLTGIIQHFRNVEEIAQMELAALNQALAQSERELDRLVVSAESARLHIEKEQTVGIQAGDLLTFGHYYQTRGRMILEQERNVTARFELFESGRQKLAESARERAAVEKIEARRFERFLSRIEKGEQQTLDELAQSIVRRKR